MMSTQPLKQDGFTVAALIIGGVLYTLLNLVAIAVQYIPNMTTLMVCGGLLPAVSCLATCTWLYRRRNSLNHLLPLSLSTVAFFLFSGYSYFSLITAMWASI